jgi:hypothetical protein
MWFRKKVRNKVYGMYLNGTSLMSISLFMGLKDKDVDEIIDYMNEIYNI